ncbi:MAG: class II aldolase/adducin family protein, partial [Candidatus Saccharicenans sp.]|nr:class II aldolase/adducin family protein [Candidatus Saccharicenans sp.]
THLHLYRHFPQIGGIAHAHSEFATAFAQAAVEIPCLGTTHADFCPGPVPITRTMTENEVTSDYELNTGKVIVERFEQLDPAAYPACLVSGHGPFAWGKSGLEAVENLLLLETIARMAVLTLQINSGATELEPYLMRKHFERKHGPRAYYGQKKEE